jgi:hypothetical protein
MVYDSAPLRKNSTRLLKLLPPENGTIRCQLDVVDLGLGSEPSLRALSYTWGPPTRRARENGMTDARTFSILCNEEQLHVTENLFHFLHFASARPEDYDGYFWIDAISINQDDKAEKLAEVSKMADIYRSAGSVLVWLGEHDEFSEKAIELISILAEMPLETLKDLNPDDMEDASLVTQRFGETVTPEHWTSLGWFLQRAWFTRVWIIQEIVLANDIKMLCGTQKLDWKSLVFVCRYVQKSSWMSYFIDKTPSEFDRTFSGSSPVVLDGLRQIRDQNEDWRLDMFLTEARGYRAADPNDHVYALLSLVQDRFVHAPSGKPELVPDYDRDFNETYALVARLILEHGQDLLLLSMVEDATARSMNGIPSWVPDWRVCYVGIGLSARAYFSAAAGMSQKARFVESSGMLRLRGAFLDGVVEVGPSRYKSSRAWEDFKKWLRIIEPLDPIYFTGQSRTEVFWRTMILDRDALNEIHPSPSSMELSFISWIQFFATGLITMANLTGHSVDSAAELIYIHGLLKDPGIRIHLPEMKEHLSAFASREFSKLADLGAAMDPYDNSFVFGESLALFRTAKGYLGYGPVSTMPHDEVWILPGATVPFVLRKTSEGRYLIVGDTYVHGVMHGEALTGMGLEFTDIEME